MTARLQLVSDPGFAALLMAKHSGEASRPAAMAALIYLMGAEEQTPAERIIERWKERTTVIVRERTPFAVYPGLAGMNEAGAARRAMNRQPLPQLLEQPIGESAVIAASGERRLAESGKTAPIRSPKNDNERAAAHLQGPQQQLHPQSMVQSVANNSGAAGLTVPAVRTMRTWMEGHTPLTRIGAGIGTFRIAGPGLAPLKEWLTLQAQSGEDGTDFRQGNIAGPGLMLSGAGQLLHADAGAGGGTARPAEGVQQPRKERQQQNSGAGAGGGTARPAEGVRQPREERRQQNPDARAAGGTAHPAEGMQQPREGRRQQYSDAGATGRTARPAEGIQQPREGIASRATVRHAASVQKPLVEEQPSRHRSGEASNQSSHQVRSVQMPLASGVPLRLRSDETGETPSRQAGNMQMPLKEERLLHAHTETTGETPSRQERADEWLQDARRRGSVRQEMNDGWPSGQPRARRSVLEGEGALTSLPQSGHILKVQAEKIGRMWAEAASSIRARHEIGTAADGVPRLTMLFSSVGEGESVQGGRPPAAGGRDNVGAGVQSSHTVSPSSYELINMNTAGRHLAAQITRFARSRAGRLKMEPFGYGPAEQAGSNLRQVQPGLSQRSIAADRADISLAVIVQGFNRADIEVPSGSESTNVSTHSVLDARTDSAEGRGWNRANRFSRFHYDLTSRIGLAEMPLGRSGPAVFPAFREPLQGSAAAQFTVERSLGVSQRRTPAMLAGPADPAGSPAQAAAQRTGEVPLMPFMPAVSAPPAMQTALAQQAAELQHPAADNGSGRGSNADAPQAVRAAAASGPSAAALAGQAPPGGAGPFAPAGRQGAAMTDAELKRLTDQVYRMLERKLRIAKERRGL